MAYLSIYIVVAAWAAFILVWFASAFTAKRSKRSNWLTTNILLRLVIAVIIVLLLHFQLVSHAQLVDIAFGRVHDIVAQMIGAVLCALGIAFAIWARVYLGRNWGMPMTKRAEPELVTSGPYRFVRHPIYTGMILAFIGTTLAVGDVWLVVLVFGGAYFVFSAWREEKFLLKQFPNQYPEYMKHSKMLVPFVF